MAKMIYSVAEMIEDLNWTMEEVDEAIRTSRSLSQIKGFSDDAKRPFVQWDDYHDKMQLCRTAWADFLATDSTGRDAADFDVSVLENMEKVAWNWDADYLARTGVIVKPGFFRRGDRIVVREGDTYIGRKGGDVQMKPRTIRIVEIAAERDGTVRARVVVEEALAEMTEKEQAIALASSDERRKISQKADAAETRKTAKALGGKALSGTPAQQKWAEDLRKTALTTVSSEVAETLLEGKKFQASKWWIENRKTLDAGWLAQQAA